MTFTLPGLIVLIVIAALCGALGKALVGGGGGGLITSIALGFIGAILGPWVAAQLHLAEPLVLQVSGQPFPIVWSIIGAALFVALLHLMSGRRRWARA
jgi:uncharacterized membrane protein YeaQ/YmgE (transglycosylase-associated protein family)